MEIPAITVLALGIATFEGKPGDRNWRNNNPTNLKFAHQRHATGQDPQGFAIFDTFEHGLEAGEEQLLLDLSRHPNWSFTQLIDTWAPRTDGNLNNDRYASFLAGLLGLNTDSTLAQAITVL